MSEMTPRLRRRIDVDFPDDPTAVAQLLTAAAESERVQAAVVFWSQGDWNRLDDALTLVELDWRNALVRAGLENDDWEQRLDEELGPR